MAKPITNTTAQAKANPMLPLLEAALRGSSKAIEQMEAQGQKELVQSDVLPVDMSTEARRVLEYAGLAFGEPVDGDPLFLHAQLPAGWTRQGSKHALHSYLLDEQGRKRASVFYKAAFYDRRAHLAVFRRFEAGLNIDYPDCFPEEPAFGVVMDAKKRELFRTEPVADSAWEQRRGMLKVVESWLDTYKPWWKNPGAYWIEP